MTIIINNDGQAYQTANTGTTIGAVIAGGAAAGGFNSINQKIIAPQLIKQYKNNTSNIDVKAVQKGIKDAFEKSNLKNNGTEFLDLREVKPGEEIPQANKKLLESLKKLTMLFIPKKHKNDVKFQKQIETKLKPLVSIFERGNNAVFIGLKTNKIAVNTEKLGVAAFHEMGHAINYNQSKFWKTTHLLRMPSMLLAGIFTLTGLLKRKKIEGEEPKNNFDKATTFIKNNVGKLATIALVPVVAEELMASYRGEKLAKQVLSPELLKKVKNVNKISALSYISFAAIAGLSAYAGSKVRDAIARPKEIV